MADRDTNRTPRPKRQEPSGVAGIITVVVSVVVILLIIWFLANKLIDMTGKSAKEESTSIALSETSGESSSEQASSEESQAESSSAEQSAAQSSEEKIKPITEGAGDTSEPKTWIGKTFSVSDVANVRSGPGTDNEVAGSAESGDTIFVQKAELDSDGTVWVYGTITGSDGTFEGWIYSPALESVPVTE